MTEESRTGAGMDPTGLWGQWFEAGSRMWSEALQNAQEGGYTDPYGLYRQWFEGAERLRDQMMGAAGAAGAVADGQQGPAGLPTGVDSQEAWGRWVEAALESWQKTAGLGTGMVSMTPRWTQMLDQVRENLLQVQEFPSDPLELAVQWYNATSGPFSEFVQDVIEREDFLALSSRSMQNYASAYKIFGRNAEEYLHNLQMPARSDVTRVAGLVVALEDKVDRLEEAFEEFEYGYTEPATAEGLGALEERVGRVEGKLDQLLSAVEGLSTNGNGTSGAATSAAEPAAAEPAGQPAGQPAEQPDEHSEEVKATNAARRKAEELGVDLATVEGTGADGQVTVGDVREKGDS